MSKLTPFLKQHIIWAVAVTVSAPLLIILILQYRSVIQLRETLPIANRAMMRKYLGTLALSVEDHYRTVADQSLSIPPEILAADRAQKNMNDVGRYFEQHQSKEAKRLFIAFTGENKTYGIYSVVYFYDPSATSKFSRAPGSPQWRAAYNASSGYLFQAITSNVVSTPPMTVDEQDSDNRAIVRPIIDSKSMLVGAAGMIIDDDYFKQDILPTLIRESLQTSFPNDFPDVIVTLQDASGTRLFETQSSEGKDFEVVEPLRFIFKDLSFKIVMRSNSLEQTARRVLAVNLSLSVLMTALIIAGIYMALRTTSREMKLSRMKSDFVSNVSHELRTPLASIRVFGEFFRLGWVKDPEKSREYGEYIENESRRLTHLVNNILDFSKIESGSKAYAFEETDVREIVDETLKMFDLRLIQDGFDLKLDGFDHELPRVAVNRDAITQSLVNLIDNAIKYSGSSKELTIRLGQEEGYVTVSVTDFGVGIAREEQQRIFDKFYRVSTGLVHDVKGSGLGLSIVKHIVDAHQGKIGVKSQPGLGTTLTLYLPSDRDSAKDHSRHHTEESDAILQA